MQRWEDLEQFLIDEAERDLQEGVDIRPCLVAFDGERPLMLGFLRSFERGHYDDPMIELLALAGPLGADRLMFSIGARAWSWDDPIPPVIDGVGDMRQRVLTITTAVANGETTEVSTALHPFTVKGNSVTWQDALRHPGGEGWITGALRVFVERRGELTASQREMRKQAKRCVALGHLVAFGEEGLARMGRKGSASARR